MHQGQVGQAAVEKKGLEEVVDSLRTILNHFETNETRLVELADRIQAEVLGNKPEPATNPAPTPEGYLPQIQELLAALHACRHGQDAPIRRLEKLA